MTIVEASWRPATSDEGFEIVRRRLFEPLDGPAAFTQRDLAARAFGDLYRAQSAEFPSECRTADYEKRIQAAYPIHPGSSTGSTPTGRRSRSSSGRAACCA